MKIATKEPAFVDDMQLEYRAIAGDPAGVACDRTSVTYTSHAATGNLGVIQVERVSWNVGVLGLEDRETYYLSVEEARELIQNLEEAVAEARESLLDVL